MTTSSPSGRVTVSPQVLITVVQQTAINTEGVLRLATKSPVRSKFKGRRTTAPGVEVILDQGHVHIATLIHAEPGINMVRLAEALQREIARSIEHIIGLEVAGVDVYIDDVVFPAERSSL